MRKVSCRVEKGQTGSLQEPDAQQPPDRGVVYHTRQRRPTPQRLASQASKYVQPSVPWDSSCRPGPSFAPVQQLAPKEEKSPRSTTSSADRPWSLSNSTKSGRTASAGPPRKEILERPHALSQNKMAKGIPITSSPRLQPFQQRHERQAPMEDVQDRSFSALYTSREETQSTNSAVFAGSGKENALPVTGNIPPRGRLRLRPQRVAASPRSIASGDVTHARLKPRQRSCSASPPVAQSPSSCRGTTPMTRRVASYGLPQPPLNSQQTATCLASSPAASTTSLPGNLLSDRSHPPPSFASTLANSSDQVFCMTASPSARLTFGSELNNITVDEDARLQIPPPSLNSVPSTLVDTSNAPESHLGQTKADLRQVISHRRGSSLQKNAPIDQNAATRPVRKRPEIGISRGAQVSRFPVQAARGLAFHSRGRGAATQDLRIPNSTANLAGAQSCPVRPNVAASRSQPARRERAGAAPMLRAAGSHGTIKHCRTAKEAVARHPTVTKKGWTFESVGESPINNFHSPEPLRSPGINVAADVPDFSASALSAVSMSNSAVTEENRSPKVGNFQVNLDLSSSGVGGPTGLGTALEMKQQGLVADPGTLGLDVQRTHGGFQSTAEEWATQSRLQSPPRLKGFFLGKGKTSDAAAAEVSDAGFFDCVEPTTGAAQVSNTGCRTAGYESGRNEDVAGGKMTMPGGGRQELRLEKENVGEVRESVLHSTASHEAPSDAKHGSGSVSSSLAKSLRSSLGLGSSSRESRDLKLPLITKDCFLTAKEERSCEAPADSVLAASQSLTTSCNLSAELSFRDTAGSNSPFSELEGNPASFVLSDGSQPISHVPPSTSTGEYSLLRSVSPKSPVSGEKMGLPRKVSPPVSLIRPSSMGNEVVVNSAAVQPALIPSHPTLTSPLPSKRSPATTGRDSPERLELNFSLISSASRPLRCTQQTQLPTSPRLSPIPNTAPFSASSPSAAGSLQDAHPYSPRSIQRRSDVLREEQLELEKQEEQLRQAAMDIAREEEELDRRDVLIRRRATGQQVLHDPLLLLSSNSSKASEQRVSPSTPLPTLLQRGSLERPGTEDIEYLSRSGRQSFATGLIPKSIRSSQNETTSADSTPDAAQGRTQQAVVAQDTPGWIEALPATAGVAAQTHFTSTHMFSLRDRKLPLGSLSQHLEPTSHNRSHCGHEQLSDFLKFDAGFETKCDPTSGPRRPGSPSLQDSWGKGSAFGLMDAGTVGRQPILPPVPPRDVRRQPWSVSAPTSTETTGRTQERRLCAASGNVRPATPPACPAGRLRSILPPGSTSEQFTADARHRLSSSTSYLQASYRRSASIPYSSNPMEGRAIGTRGRQVSQFSSSGRRSASTSRLEVQRRSTQGGSGCEGDAAVPETPLLGERSSLGAGASIDPAGTRALGGRAPDHPSFFQWLKGMKKSQNLRAGEGGPVRSSLGEASKILRGSLCLNNDSESSRDKSLSWLDEICDPGCEVGTTARLSDFDVDKCPLGTGRTGLVYKAVERDSGKPVALKAMSLASIKQMEFDEQVKSELFIQRDLRHTNIIELLGFFRDSTRLFMVLELANGGTLRDILKRSKLRFNETQVAVFAYQLARGLDYMHSLNTIHRDLKPDNILIHNPPAEELDAICEAEELHRNVYRFGIAKIADFGFACRTSSSQKRKTFCGTADYLAPEMVEEQAYDSSVDLWCLGVTLYELLTGLPPFSSTSKEALYNRITTEQLSFPSQISSQAARLVRELCHKDPRLRPTAAEVMSDRWIRSQLMVG